MTHVSIIPGPPLTDEVFPFNKEAFIQIRNYQEKLVVFCSYLQTHLTNFCNVPEI